MAAASAAGLDLRETPAGLVISDGSMELVADLGRMLPRLRQGSLQAELLVRAARVRGVEAPTAIDACAGLGEDGLLLAAAGLRVTLFELDPVIAALLRDALGRAAAVPGLAEAAARMTLVEGDSVAALRALHAPPDVVFLDPMFPERHKSAAVKKKFQLLHRLERPCGNEAELLGAALAARPRKVVVKRPPKGPWLAGTRPSYCLRGKSVRYDVLVPPRAQGIVAVASRGPTSCARASSPA